MISTRALAIAVSPFFAACAYAAPSLVGDTVQRVAYGQATGEISNADFGVVVDPGAEFIDSSPLAGGEFRRFDLGATSIRLETSIAWYSPWFETGYLPTYVEFRDLDFNEPGWTIAGVNVTWGGTIFPESGAPLNYPAFGPDAVRFNADTVRIYTGPYQFDAGSWVQIDLVLVPSPASLCLMGLGGIVAGRRRRQVTACHSGRLGDLDDAWRGSCQSSKGPASPRGPSHFTGSSDQRWQSSRPRFLRYFWW